MTTKSFFRHPEVGEYDLVPEESEDAELLDSSPRPTDWPLLALSCSDEFDVLDSLTPEEYTINEKRLLRRIDMRLMPCLFAMVVLNYLDRNALANARIQGIELSLDLIGSEFNTAVSAFFIGYLALQIPSNILLTRLRPSWYLPGCMLAWGILSGSTAFVKGFHSLTTVRFLLGIVEAPFFPGALFILSSWYTKEELAFRTSILYSGSLLSGAFGGLIGAGVQEDLDFAGGLESWRWLFIIEASTTIIVAICVIFILPDFPRTTKWLTQEERAIAIRRMQITGTTDSRDDNIIDGIVMVVRDYKVWLLAIVIATKTSAGAIVPFIPTLVSTITSWNDPNPSALDVLTAPEVTTKISTLLLVAPPYIFATLISLIIAYSSDRHSRRASHIIIPMASAVFAFLGFGATLNPFVRYGCLFVILGGVYGSFDVALAWISNTIPSPALKRSTAIALINTIGNLSQIFVPYLYLQKSAPRYLGAMLANAGFCLLCIGAAAVLWRCLKRENEAMDRKTRTGSAEDDDDYRSEDPGFRYIL